MAWRSDTNVDEAKPSERRRTAFRRRPTRQPACLEGVDTYARGDRMALIIRNPEAERLAREISRCTGEAVGDAGVRALAERLRRVEAAETGPGRLADALNEIALRCAALPRLDDRSEGEILGYDERGIPD